MKLAVSQGEMRVYVDRGGEKPTTIPVVTMTLVRDGTAGAIEMTPGQVVHLVHQLEACLPDPRNTPWATTPARAFIGNVAGGMFVDGCTCGGMDRLKAAAEAVYGPQNPPEGK